MAEELRNWTANQKQSPCVGLNPNLIELFLGEISLVFDFSNLNFSQLCI